MELCEIISGAAAVWSSMMNTQLLICSALCCLIHCLSCIRALCN
jgi:hypothetical protein